MKQKYILGAFLVLPVLFLFFWLGSIEYALHAEQTVVIRMSGYDPRDLLSGHYLHLQPDWSLTDCRQFTDNRCPTERFGRSYRYYLPEFDAQKVDRQLRLNNVKIEMIFTYKGAAKPLVKDLLINGMVWDRWLTQSAKPPVAR